MDSDEAPNLILVGPGKTGTTALYSALVRAGIGSMGAKEFRTFLVGDVETVRSRIVPLKSGQRYVIDATPAYFVDGETVAGGILAVYRRPEALRFIVMYRDPVERAESDFFHRAAAGWLSLTSFDSYARGIGPQRELERWEHMLSGSRYRTHLSTWLRSFDERQFLILESRKMIQNDDTFLAQLTDFLGCELPHFWTDRENEQMEPRFPRFQKFKHEPSLLKNMLKQLIPYRARQVMSQRFHELNHMPAKQRRRLTDAQRATLASLIGHGEALSEEEIRNVSLLSAANAPAASAG